MASKPPISVRRPHRTVADAPQGAPVQISHAPVPNIDPDGPEALAFAMRGRMSATLPMGEGEGAPKPSVPADTPPAPAHSVNQQEQHLTESRFEPPPATGPWNRGEESSEHATGATAAEETPLISVKLPPEIGRHLAAVADRRGSKRTMVAIEVLTEPLRQLAAEHRAGRFPELPRIVSGTVRSSIAFALPPDLAADLEFVLHQRRAVRAQVVTRLLVPAIERVYATEVGGRDH
jgi:hypothetical protein